MNKLEQAFADLILMGWDASASYALLHPQSKATGGSLKVLASRLKTSPKVAEYLKKKELELTNNSIEVNSEGVNSLPLLPLSIEDIELDEGFLTRTNQIKRYKFIMDSTTDKRIKIACLEAITKLAGYHKEKPEEGERVIFYLPLRCSDCKLYQKEDEQRKLERAERIQKNFY